MTVTFIHGAATSGKSSLAQRLVWRTQREVMRPPHHASSRGWELFLEHASGSVVLIEEFHAADAAENYRRLFAAACGDDDGWVEVMRLGRDPLLVQLVDVAVVCVSNYPPPDYLARFCNVVEL